MTRDDIIRMAREAGFTEGDIFIFPDLIVHFAALVAAHERKPLTDELLIDALRQMVEGMEQAAAGERIDFQGYAMGGRSVLEKIEVVE